jgi:diacylglycerol kinase (ATP)
LICIGVVLSAELLNTAIEKLVDLVSPQFNPKAGEIKDISAAAVFVLAMISAIIGCVIFIPYLSELL